MSTTVPRWVRRWPVSWWWLLLAWPVLSVAAAPVVGRLLHEAEVRERAAR